MTCMFINAKWQSDKVKYDYFVVQTVEYKFQQQVCVIFVFVIIYHQWKDLQFNLTFFRFCFYLLLFLFSLSSNLVNLK